MPVLAENAFWFSCDEMTTGRGGTPYSLDRNRTHIRKHKVVVKLKEMSDIAVALCPLLPRPGSFYIVFAPVSRAPIEYDRQAILTRQTCEQQDPDDWQVWIVTSEYTTIIPGQFRTDIPSQSSEDPTKDLANVDWDFETIQMALPYDLLGNPYTNTAHKRFTPSITFEADYPVLTISRNELTFNYGTAAYYARSLNDSDFLGAPAGCVQVLPPKTTQKNLGIFRYWRTTYKIRIRPQQRFGGYILPKANYILPTFDEDDHFVGYQSFPNDDSIQDTWQPMILNESFYELSKGPPEHVKPKGEPIEIRESGKPIRHPQIIDFEGHRVKAANPAVDPTVPQWYKRFFNYRYVDIETLLVVGLQ